MLRRELARSAPHDKNHRSGDRWFHFSFAGERIRPAGPSRRTRFGAGKHARGLQDGVVDRRDHARARSRHDERRLKPGTALAAAFPEQRGMDGVRIPTLMEVFDLVRRANAGHIRFNIETKLTPTSGADTPDPERFAAATVQAVREAELTARGSIQSFDWRTLAVLRRIAPQIERVCLTSDGGDGDTLQRGQPGPSPWTAGLDIDDFAGSTPRLVVAAGCSVWSP